MNERNGEPGRHTTLMLERQVMGILYDFVALSTFECADMCVHPSSGAILLLEAFSGWIHVYGVRTSE